MKTYLVGGAVRDKLLGLEPKDRDWLIVGATEHDVQNLLDQGYEQVGADFPVFLHPLTKEEYALARVERKAGVGYHGFEIDSSSTVTVEEDLARRDLTINSMALDVQTGKLVDPFNGRRDLLNGILRNTSPAFAEDPLRILRLARFASRFPKFRICNSTVDLCCDLAKCGELNYLATERVWTEIDKGFREKHPDIFLRTLHKLQVLEHCNVLRGIFGNVLSHSQEAVCRALTAVEADKRLLVGTATLALKTDAALIGATKRITDLYAYMFEFRHTSRSAIDLAKLLKRTGALRDGPSFSDFCCAITVMELAGFRRSLAFTARELQNAASVVREIRSTRFPTMEGRALGEAIDNERVQTLHRSFSIPIEVLKI